MMTELTKSDLKKFVKKIRGAKREIIIAVSEDFLKSKELSINDMVDYRTWTKISDKQIEEIKNQE